MLSAICFNLNKSKILSSGNGLIAIFHLSSVASLNLGQSENGVLGNVLNSRLSRARNEFQSHTH